MERTQVKELRREERTKVEAFGNLEFFQAGRKCASSGGSTAAVRSAGERRSGPLVFTSRR
jgi:hypothetical protein